ncbi:serine hydrolase [Arenivirga flava]|uniref:Serine hydrolase n=1 Tax=Arenivirga flava TaxID=1930060 RepID=A0AA37UES4_9MICO|nr:serine hydrolase [Arenivirga flava]GMA29073.1 serine hydrolase [Arenivirga flava]
MSEGQPALRRDRRRSRAGGRHRGEASPAFAVAFSRLGELAYTGAQVSASVRAVAPAGGADETLLAVDDTVAMPMGSIGKVLLLVEAAARIGEGRVPGLGVLDRSVADATAGSGVWRYLQASALPTADLAVLVGVLSDNLATNVLLREIGLEAVRARAESLGLRRTALLDRVRDRRGPDDAPQFSVGSTEELSGLFAALTRGEAVDRLTSHRVLDWLSLGADLSMTASAFGLDPLAHTGSDHGLRLSNKTGTDDGLRAEAGVLTGPRGRVSYAIAIRFEDRSLGERLRVLSTMRTLGEELLEYVH